MHYSKGQQDSNVTSIRKLISSLDYLRVFMRQENTQSLLQRNKALYLHGLQKVAAAGASGLHFVHILSLAERLLTLTLETAHSSPVLWIDKSFKNALRCFFICDVH